MPIDGSDLTWTPGSFTKNFSWGNGSAGLRALHQHIRVGFDSKIEDVPRELYRQRVAKLQRPDQIATNFFLSNGIRDGQSYILADELVFQAIAQEHSPAFDALALTALNLSFVGVWVGQQKDQRRPALWAHYYVRDRLSTDSVWSADRVSALDIESFINSSPRYRAQDAGKISTNLAYIYRIGGLSRLASLRIERWWVDSLFLALDRITDDLRADGNLLLEKDHIPALQRADFFSLTGGASLQKQLAAGHLSVLYNACGGRERFVNAHVKEVHELKLPEVQWLLANDDRPQGALHPTNPRILKSIPRSCALLAKYVARYEIIEADELATFDPEEFVRRRTREALASLKAENVRSELTSYELERLTRDR